MPTVNRSRHNAVAAFEHDGRRESSKRGNADDRNIEGQADRSRRGDANPDSGEGPRTNGDGDAIECADPARRGGDNAVYQGNDRLILPPIHLQGLLSENLRSRTVEYTGGCGRQRRIDS